jgi:hypothetical protein|nr:MAG TPA: hypothetical protein [Caudoviricetes sp.]
MKIAKTDKQGNPTSKLFLRIGGSSILIASKLTVVQAVLLKKQIEEYTKKTGSKINGHLYTVQ